MKKLILSVFISMLATGSYAQNQVGFGADLGIGMNRTPNQIVVQPQVIRQQYNNTPPRTTVQTNQPNYNASGLDQSGVDSYVPPDADYIPIYKTDTVTASVEQENETVQPEKTEGSMFKDCMLRSAKMLDVLDILKKIPEKDRISTLYNSGYWGELTESEKDRTLQTIASMNGVDDPTYLVIKGKMAGSFEKECVDFAKKN